MASYADLMQSLKEKPDAKHVGFSPPQDRTGALFVTDTDVVESGCRATAHPKVMDQVKRLGIMSVPNGCVSANGPSLHRRYTTVHLYFDSAGWTGRRVIR